jgi:hypothetical protein
LEGGFVQAIFGQVEFGKLHGVIYSNPIKDIDVTKVAYFTGNYPFQMYIFPIRRFNRAENGT